MLTVHPSRAKDVLTEHRLLTSPKLPRRDYRDMFGDACTRVVAPPGLAEFKADFEIYDSGKPDEVMPHARQLPVEELPDDALVFLLGSRYCDTQSLSDFARRTFGASKPGWARVQAICDFVHNHIKFGYPYARDDRTASDAHRERVGVCRDFAHLAITLSLHEHPCPVLHGLPRRHWGAAGLSADGFQRLVRGVSRWPLAHFRCTAQPPTHRSYSDRTGTRCSGRSDLDKLRSSKINAFQSDYRRTSITKQCPGGSCPQSELCLTSSFEKWQCVAKAIRQ
jgi:Transglutaminase-like superfamily